MIEFMKLKSGGIFKVGECHFYLNLCEEMVVKTIEIFPFPDIKKFEWDEIKMFKISFEDEDMKPLNINPTDVAWYW